MKSLPYPLPFGARALTVYEAPPLQAFYDIDPTKPPEPFLASVTRAIEFTTLTYQIVVSNLEAEHLAPKLKSKVDTGLYEMMTSGNFSTWLKVVDKVVADRNNLETAFYKMQAEKNRLEYDLKNSRSQQHKLAEERDKQAQVAARWRKLHQERGKKLPLP